MSGTLIDLDPIRRRVAAAHGGPWKWTHHRSGAVLHPVAMDGWIDLSEWEIPGVITDGRIHTADAALVMAAPTDIATLLIELDRLRREVDER